MVGTVGSLCWKDLSVEDVEDYLQLTDNSSRMVFLVSRVDLPGENEPERRAIVLDLYLYCLQFVQNQGFTADKISAAFSIIKDTHEISMKSLWPVSRSIKHFQDLLLRHSVHRPPYSTGLFSTHDVQTFSNYVSKSYFRHYMLYKYAFTKKTEMAFSTFDTYTKAVPSNFIIPLSAGEDEDSKLKNDEEAALAALQPPGNAFLTSVLPYTLRSGKITSLLYFFWYVRTCVAR